MPTSRSRRWRTSKGLKLRFPTRLAGEALKRARRQPDRHADPAGAGEPGAEGDRRLRRALGGRARDQGAGTASRTTPSIPGSPTFYVATFVLAMNKAKLRCKWPGRPQGGARQELGLAAADHGRQGLGRCRRLSVLEMVKKRGNSHQSTLSSRRGKPALAQDDRAGDRSLDQDVGEGPQGPRRRQAARGSANAPRRTEIQGVQTP
jgi:hypothetical protein